MAAEGETYISEFKAFTRTGKAPATRQWRQEHRRVERWWVIAVKEAGLIVAEMDRSAILRCFVAPVLSLRSHVVRLPRSSGDLRPLAVPSMVLGWDKRVQAKQKSAHFAQKPFKLKQFSAVTVVGTCCHRLTDSLGGGGENPKDVGLPALRVV